MLPPFHGERMRAYEQVIREATEREVAAWPLGERVRAPPEHAGDHARGDPASGLRGRGRPAPRRAARATSSRSSARPLAGWRSGSRSRACAGCPRTARMARMLADTDELLLAEIAERRADPELDERDDILSLLVAARFEDGSADGGPRASRPADDPAARRPRDDRDRRSPGPSTCCCSAPDALAAPAAGGRRRRASDYLDAVIEETLRVRPVVPFTGRQLRAAAELGGYGLPAGTVVMPAIYLAHTRPDIYPNPYAFRPERFLDGGPETYSWIPFGGGTRRCIGAAFAAARDAGRPRDDPPARSSCGPATDRPRAHGATQRHPVAARAAPRRSWPPRR